MSLLTQQSVEGRPTVDNRWIDSRTGEVCGIAKRLGIEVPCPKGGCTLLAALGHEARTDPSEVCPVEEIAERAGFEPVVLRTFDELRREFDRIGVTLSAARATRTRGARHDATLDRWPRET